MRPSNYDLQAQAAGHSFAAQDLDAIAARFALRRDETYLYLELLHEPLRLSRADGAAERQHGGVWMPAGFGAAMTAYDLLSNPNGFPVLAGQWCSHDSFNAVQAGTLLRTEPCPVSVAQGRAWLEKQTLSTTLFPPYQASAGKPLLICRNVSFFKPAVNATDDVVVLLVCLALLLAELYSKMC